MVKMATYPGMSLRSEVRESISIDEDDLSDVEDEVFIRDGKNSYKLAEELNAKRPLMPLKRKLGKSVVTTRLKTRPSCKILCKSCCYISAALSILIGLIALAVVLISIFPLPLDKLRGWIISTSKLEHSDFPSLKLLPCNNLKITEIWSTNLPILTTDSPVRVVDINQDGIDDIVFGFGTGDNEDILPPEMFCSIFLGVSPPCEGGVIALNGSNGDIIWRYWLNDTIYTLLCTEDLNGDYLNDCLAIGVKGTILAINAQNGSVIWQQNNDKRDLFAANFIPDQNNDNITEILTTHSTRDGKESHLIIISGSTGQNLQRSLIPYGAQSFYMPQLLKVNSSTIVTIFGTGDPNTAGNLSVSSLESINRGNFSFQTIYEDHYKGIFIQSILVDLTGDNVSDIITAMYNTTVVAIDGATLKQIWNYTIPNGETNIIPTPGYFNYDNITDFLIIYQLYDNVLKYSYTNTFIIDGKTGRPIYENTIIDSVVTQMGGLTIGMESYGFDMYLFWTFECNSLFDIKDIEPIADCHKKSDKYSAGVMKLNALNQCDQPPGFEIYSSRNRSYNFNIKSPIKQIKEYFIKQNLRTQMINSQTYQMQPQTNENDDSDTVKTNIRTYGNSNFRHNNNRLGIAKDYPINKDNNPLRTNEEPVAQKNSPEYNFDANNLESNLFGNADTEFNNYDYTENSNTYNNKKMLFDAANYKNNRDPRSKSDEYDYLFSSEKPSAISNQSKSKKKNLSDSKSPGVYDVKNIQMSKNRLLHDLNNIPTEILMDTYLKNRESQLRKSKFEQRDIDSHVDKIKENKELKILLDAEKKKALNSSYTLWDLESEKELEDRENDKWRGKRQINTTIFPTIQNISSVGTLVKSLYGNRNNTIDIIFVTYWQFPELNLDAVSDKEISDCVEEKLWSTSSDSYLKTTEDEKRRLFLRECLSELDNLKNQYPDLNDFYRLKLGQMTVYRLRIECHCDPTSKEERCANFLPYDQQYWDNYLGKKGDGVFIVRN